MTGTPLAYLKRLDRWARFCACTLLGLTVRRTAAHLDLHRDTAFRWRHRLLAGLLATERPLLHGTVTVAEARFAYSEKGCRDLDRPPRRRGDRRLALRAEAVRVLVAFDDRDGAAGQVVGQRLPRVADVARLLDGRLAELSPKAERPVRTRRGRRLGAREPGFQARTHSGRQSRETPADVSRDQRHRAPVRRTPTRHRLMHGAAELPAMYATELTSRDGRRGAVAGYARQARLRWRHRGPADAAAAGGWDPGFLYTRRMRFWFRRFRGVATRYLAHYLVWFRLVERTGRAADALRAPHRIRDRLLAGAFP